MKRFLTVGAIVFAGLIAIAIAVIGTACALDLWNQNRPHHFSGIVSDCQTGQPIEDAKIELWQQTLLTWDKIHRFYGTSDAQGRFDIPYDIGDNINARTSKEGYLLSDDHTDAQTTRIGLVKEAANEADLWHQGAIQYSQNCKRGFECNQETIKDGVKMITNICGALPLLEPSVQK